MSLKKAQMSAEERKAAEERERAEQAQDERRVFLHEERTIARYRFCESTEARPSMYTSFAIQYSRWSLSAGSSALLPTMENISRSRGISYLHSFRTPRRISKMKLDFNWSYPFSQVKSSNQRTTYSMLARKRTVVIPSVRSNHQIDEREIYLKSDGSVVIPSARLNHQIEPTIHRY
jgi:hypothetical protein